MRDVTALRVDELESDADATAGAWVMDEPAFQVFYDRTARPLWAYLSRMTGSADLADDLLQESYYRFLRACPACEDESHRRHYLFRIATNLVRDGARRRACRPVFSAHDEGELPGDRTLAQRTESRADLRGAMARLTPRERQLLWLAYAQGASHREMSTVLGLRAGSIKPLLFRARRRLALLLRAAGYGGGDRG
jgi:RNA polymerase sigma-70 factor (ECF subfamily)